MVGEVLDVIPESELVKDRFYLGRGRNRDVGLYDGANFITFCYKFDFLTSKVEGYLSDDETDQGGCFQPFLLLPTLEEVVDGLQPITKEKLAESRFYFGRGKHNYIGYWNNGKFVTLGRDGNLITPRVEEYFSHFIPFKLVPQAELVEAWERDRRYGKKCVLN
jgi:hypothetical protein